MQPCCLKQATGRTELEPTFPKEPTTTTPIKEQVSLECLDSPAGAMFTMSSTPMNSPSKPAFPRDSDKDYLPEHAPEPTSTTGVSTTTGADTTTDVLLTDALARSPRHDNGRYVRFRNSGI